MSISPFDKTAKLIVEPVACKEFSLIRHIAGVTLERFNQSEEWRLYSGRFYV
jgi:hypothetical protein